MDTKMVKELIDSGRLRFHHRAARRGYVSRREWDGVPELYNGRFGKGVVILSPRWDTTQYIWVEYYIADNAETYAVLSAWEALAED